MLRFSRFLALGAFFVALAVALAACGGNSIPGNAVAKVGGTAITKDTFNHWMTVAAISSAGSTTGATGATATVPDAPSFTQCIANKRKTAPAPAKGQPKPSDATFKSQCSQEYESLKQQVLQFLISSDWIQGESKAQNVTVSDADVEKQFQATKKQSFPKAADFDKFLKTSGMTLDDIKFRVRLDALSNALRKKITTGKDKVSAAQISDYYNKNKSRFAQPERRDLRIVLTKTAAKANQAKAALQSGQNWKAVAKQYSIDQASKNQGGVLLAVAKGQQEKALDTAVFAAKQGGLHGPVKTQFGFYVFTVTKITTATQQSLQAASATIKQLLASQNQQKALDTFVKDFQKRWKAKTDCRTGYVTQDCSNAPKPKTTTAGAATTTAGGTTTP
ncbi:MAG: foldase protein PrsA [Solirubrobacteraceae bacterium]|jgi:foldase protein PrsA|nr:foldase protein PrsA [Solirubrobacteraceae bacterium]